MEERAEGEVRSMWQVASTGGGEGEEKKRRCDDDDVEGEKDDERG